MISDIYHILFFIHATRMKKNIDNIFKLYR